MDVTLLLRVDGNKMLVDFYRSKEWEKFRQVVIMDRLTDSGESICEYCGKPIVKAYDLILHHKTYLTEENYLDSTISLNPDNIQLLHHRCHNSIHNKLGYSKREVFIVYGSPLAGKSSFVAEVMNEGDLIVDIDNLWEAVSGCDKYVKPNRLKSVVFSLRDNLLESVKYRRGKWSNAYIIGSYPFEAERNRLADTLGARLIHIDTDKAECIARLESCDDGRNKNEWLEYIDSYWLQYSGGY